MEVSTYITRLDLIVVFASITSGLGGLLAGFTFSLIAILFVVSEKTGGLGKYIFIIAEQGFHEKTEANETTQKWQGILSIIKSKSYIFIRINSYLFHVIPKRSFANEGEFEKFWEKANMYSKQARM